MQKVQGQTRFPEEQHSSKDHYVPTSMFISVLDPLFLDILEHFYDSVVLVYTHSELEEQFNLIFLYIELFFPILSQHYFILTFQTPLR